MELLSTSIHGVHLIVPVVHRDHRGWFHRSYDEAVLAAAGLPVHWPQQNASRSLLGVVRGMHVRVGAGESKIVRCEHGAIDDVVVDVRPGSPTFLRQERFRLDDVDHRQVYLPAGVAHGYQALTDVVLVCYLHSEPYAAAERNARFATTTRTSPCRGPSPPWSSPARDAAAPLLADFLADLPRPDRVRFRASGSLAPSAAPHSPDPAVRDHKEERGGDGMGRADH